MRWAGRQVVMKDSDSRLSGSVAIAQLYLASSAGTVCFEDDGVLLADVPRVSTST